MPHLNFIIGNNCDIEWTYKLVVYIYVIFLFSSDFTYLSLITDELPPRIIFSNNKTKSLSCSVCNLISVYFNAHC